MPVAYEQLKRCIWRIEATKTFTIKVYNVLASVFWQNKGMKTGTENKLNVET